MSEEIEGALFQAVLYLLQTRSFATQGEARQEALGYIERLQKAYYSSLPKPTPK